MKIRKCTCGNDRFYAHQMCRLDVIVDGDNNFQGNAGGTAENSIYDAEAPYSPYECTKCGKEYGELLDIPVFEEEDCQFDGEEESYDKNDYSG